MPVLVGTPSGDLDDLSPRAVVPKRRADALATAAGPEPDG